MKCPWGDSNTRARLRRPVLYPLSYRGLFSNYSSPLGVGQDLWMLAHEPHKCYSVTGGIDVQRTCHCRNERRCRFIRCGFAIDPNGIRRDRYYIKALDYKQGGFEPVTSRLLFCRGYGRCSQSVSTTRYSSLCYQCRKWIQKIRCRLLCGRISTRKNSTPMYCM